MTAPDVNLNIYILISLGRHILTKNTNGTPGSGINIDILKHQPNPYPIYKTWREQHPVFQFEQTGLWAVCRYEDVCQGLLNHELFSSIAV